MVGGPPASSGSTDSRPQTQEEVSGWPGPVRQLPTPAHSSHALQPEGPPQPGGALTPRS